MDLIVNTNILRHLSRFFDRGRSVEPTIPFVMAKPLCPFRAEELQPLSRKTPEEVGLSSRKLAAFLHELQQDPELEIHGVTVLRHGTIVCDASFGAYDAAYWHAGHSLSKSVTATAIGMLIDDGRLSLDDRVVKLLEKKVPPLAQLAYKNLTLRHLLTMTSGASFSEAGVLVEGGWVKAYLESVPLFEAGTRFHYNSLNSYLLAAIVKEVTGHGLLEYLKPRLLDPLGITVYHWETSPEGIECGGWGLYLRREDVAKIGLLYLQKGVWQGRRLLSEKWIAAATRPSVPTPESYGEFDYGFHMWAGRNRSCFLFNGMFGQDMLAFPGSDILIVTNGGLEQLFQQSHYYEILFRYFGDSYPDVLPPDKMGLAALRREIAALVPVTSSERSVGCLFRKPLPPFLKRALNTTYYADRQGKDDIIRTVSMTGTANQGLLPFLEQILRNSYTDGIASFTFAYENGGLLLRVREGETSVHTLPIALGQTVRTVLRLSETDYHTAVTADAAYDEDGRGVLKLRLSFPEISGSRHIKIFFEDDALEVEMKEMPGIGLMHYAVAGIEELLRSKKRMADVVSRLDPDLLFFKLERSMEPRFRLRAKTDPSTR